MGENKKKKKKKEKDSEKSNTKAEDQVGMDNDQLTSQDEATTRKLAKRSRKQKDEDITAGDIKENDSSKQPDAEEAQPKRKTKKEKKNKKKLQEDRDDELKVEEPPQEEH